MNTHINQEIVSPILEKLQQYSIDPMTDYYTYEFSGIELRKLFGFKNGARDSLETYAGSMIVGKWDEIVKGAQLKYLISPKTVGIIIQKKQTIEKRESSKTQPSSIQVTSRAGETLANILKILDIPLHYSSASLALRNAGIEPISQHKPRRYDNSIESQERIRQVLDTLKYPRHDAVEQIMQDQGLPSKVEAMEVYKGILRERKDGSWNVRHVEPGTVRRYF